MDEELEIIDLFHKINNGWRMIQMHYHNGDLIHANNMYYEVVQASFAYKKKLDEKLRKE